MIHPLERTLFRRISRGEEKAFRQVYDLYFSRLSAFVFKLSKSTHITEEVIQDVFLRLWQSRAQLADVEQPEAWIFTMARNRCTDLLRSLAASGHFNADLPEQEPAAAYSAEERLSVNELRQLVQEALEALSIQKQTIFRLSKEEGLSHDEIAERMQLSKSTVKNHLSESLKHIRGHIQKSDNPELYLVLFLIHYLP
ncbi:RNA polymerase sigma-70 factor [Chitinophaga horti]|uniref:RNA polymerase sigma-70 factor n=1 Tax=Chitinophaga horti TaxID=2920382 RepID=A0ABY6J562_9BACT|nr:RNA polymerase sigma-70 factor [Chitinophaga horti]UYQ94815.1 RNA polymerase sigma-70 factor [Chitinophaga horti]